MRTPQALTLNVVLVHHDEDTRRALREAFTALPEVSVLGERSDLASGIAFSRQTIPDVLALELPRAMDATLSAAVEYRLAFPEAAIVFVSDRLDTDTVLRALRAGATEVLALPLNHDTLRETFERIRTQRTHREGATHHSTIVSVYGAKGGNGTSTIAANLAIGLGRENERDVVLVDLDDQSGDAAFMLGLSPVRSILDVARAANIDSTGLHDALLKHASGVHVLAQPDRREPEHGLSGEQAARILDVLSSLFDIVVADVPHVLDEFTLDLLKHSTAIVMVVEPNVPAVRACRRALEVMRRHDLLSDPQRVHLVVNRQEAHADVSLDQIHETLGLPIFATIANDYAAVQHAINNAQPLCGKGAHGKVAQDLAGLARLLLPRELAVADEVEPAEVAPPARHRFFHLLRGMGVR